VYKCTGGRSPTLTWGVGLATRIVRGVSRDVRYRGVSKKSTNSNRQTTGGFQELFQGVTPKRLGSPNGGWGTPNTTWGVTPDHVSSAGGWGTLHTTWGNQSKKFFERTSPAGGRHPPCSIFQHTPLSGGLQIRQHIERLCPPFSAVTPPKQAVAVDQKLLAILARFHLFGGHLHPHPNNVVPLEAVSDPLLSGGSVQLCVTSKLGGDTRVGRSQSKRFADIRSGQRCIVGQHTGGGNGIIFLGHSSTNLFQENQTLQGTSSCDTQILH
jgi:hypothetical protein